MTTTAPLIEVGPRPEPSASTRARRLAWAVTDGLAVAKRNLLAYVRVPQLLVFSTIQPIMFVLLFRYVFGGAIPLPNDIPYVDYLMPGIFVQTVLFGSTSTGIGLAQDAGLGLIERFRSLPMARSAVLTGRTGADVVRNILVVILMAVVGFLVGFRIHAGVASFVLALVLVVLFGFAFCWITAIVGMRASNPEAAQAAIFPILFPLTFASSAFVPVSTMPSWLQAFANHQPVTIVVNACRALTLGDLATGTTLLPDSTAEYVLLSLAWIAGILLVFAPLAVRAYRRKV